MTAAMLISLEVNGERVDAQVLPRQNMGIDALTIDVKREGHESRHAAPPVPSSGRESSVETQRASRTPARCRRMAGDAC